MKSEEKISIIIADDHPIFRQGLKTIIESDPALYVAGEACDGAEAIQLIEKLKPKIAVLDIDMPKLNGIQTAKILHDNKNPVEIVVLTMYSEEDIFNNLMKLGVKGYVLKENAASDILDAVKTAAGGKHYITPIISEHLLKLIENEIDSNTIAKKLTAMERRVLALIAENKTSKEIADELCISYKTVENHRANICAKLNLHGSNALLKFALDNKSLILS